MNQEKRQQWTRAQNVIIKSILVPAIERNRSSLKE